MTATTEFHGKWALVTGASAGIGVALARELARRGAKLILTARRADRLEELKRDLLKADPGLRIDTIPAALARAEGDIEATYAK